ncbi:type IV secretory system conjugative DNA transfer family protein [Acinetobacter baumannii]|uniref:type IV secretory system conjugative DNA transfer family protein n=1 Tax=Acinetobacter baumannii TaxID=470 RepID=UPI0035CFAD1D
MISFHNVLADVLIPAVEYSLVYGVITGFFSFFWLAFSKKEKEFLSSICAFLSALGVFSVVAWLVLIVLTPFNSKTPLILWFCGALLGVVIAFFAERKYLHVFEKVLKASTKKSDLERDKKTDVREIEKFLPVQKESYDPKKYFKKDAFFIGLNEKEEPIYWNEKTLPHIQVCGMTGSGKGVFLGSISSQCVSRNEAVVVIDPKDDEWLPHVIKQAADEANASYYFVDLTKQEYQFNIFEDATRDEIEELLLAGFELSERGEASDFYKIADRKAASFIAENIEKGNTAETLWIKHNKYLEKTAENFAGKFRELADIKAINAERGLSLKEIVENGGVVYIVGSMRNVKITRIQKMILVRLIQLAEARDRIAGNLRQVCIVLDELKYHLSRIALEALGAARDKGVHVVMAHQSIADLRDCPKDLEPHAVVGAVLENSKIKVVYRVEMPETAEIFARKSGKILVDDESRVIERSLSLADHFNGNRAVWQSERHFIDENMILNLPKGCGVVFGIGQAQFSYISPMVAVKTQEAISVPVVPNYIEIKKEKDEEVKQTINNNVINFDELG